MNTYRTLMRLAGKLGDYEGLTIETEVILQVEQGLEAEAIAQMQSNPTLVEMLSIQEDALRESVSTFVGAGFTIACLRKVSETWWGKEVVNEDQTS